MTNSNHYFGLMMRSVFSILILFVSSSLHGQSVNQFGFKGGANISTLGPIGTGYTSKIGYHFGFYSSTQFYQELSLQLEFMVSQQGARSELLSDLKLNYTYLTLPLLANIYFIESAAIESGVQVGYLLKATQVDGGDKFNRSDEVRNLDLSGIIGINYSKPFGTIGLRYVLGINNTNSASPSAEVRFANKVLQLYVAKTILKSQ